MTLNTRTLKYIESLNIGKPSRDINFLNALQRAHIAKYSFNSLSVVLSEEMNIDAHSVFEKIVTEQRGGYCFEHNKLVFDVLTDLGFQTRILIGRVIYNDFEKEAARTHRMTLVTLNDEDYIVDCGFGHDGAWNPVKLTEQSQHQGDDCYRIIKQGNDYHYQTIKEGAFFTLYTFDLNTYTETDCLLGHFYSHKHPDAGFVNNLVACRKYNGKIQSLRNHQLYTITHKHTEITKVSSSIQLQNILKNEYVLSINDQQASRLFEQFLKPSAL